MENLKVEQIEQKVADLDEGQSLLTYIRPVEGEKFSVEFAERISSPTTNTLLSMGNIDDERFQRGNKPRRGWGNFSEKSLEKVFKISLKDLTLQTRTKVNGQSMQVYCVGLLNPTAGRRVSLSVNERKQSELVPYNEETGEGSTWDSWALENYKQAAKNNGRGGYMVADGELIFSRIIPTNAKPVHRFVEHDSITDDPVIFLIPDLQIQREEKEDVVVAKKAKVESQY